MLKKKDAEHKILEKELNSGERVIWAARYSTRDIRLWSVPMLLAFLMFYFLFMEVDTGVLSDFFISGQSMAVPSDIDLIDDIAVVGVERVKEYHTSRGLDILYCVFLIIPLTVIAAFLNISYRPAYYVTDDRFIIIKYSPLRAVETLKLKRIDGIKIETRLGFGLYTKVSIEDSVLILSQMAAKSLSELIKNK